MLEVGDGDPWGREGPPEEAYSRVTRDLATIYAPLAPAAHEANAVHHWIGIKRNP